MASNVLLRNTLESLDQDFPFLRHAYTREGTERQNIAFAQVHGKLWRIGSNSALFPYSRDHLFLAIDRSPVVKELVLSGANVHALDKRGTPPGARYQALSYLR